MLANLDHQIHQRKIRLNTTLISNKIIFEQQSDTATLLFNKSVYKKLFFKGSQSKFYIGP